MKAENHKGHKKKLRVGDRVRFLLVNHPIEGVIVEDRGNLGVGGRRLWAIEFQFKYVDPSIVELSEEDILVDS